MASRTAVAASELAEGDQLRHRELELLTELSDYLGCSRLGETG